MRVRLADPNLHSFEQLLRDRLPDDEFEWHSDGMSMTGVDVFIGPQFGRAEAETSDRLRLVQVVGAGTDGIALESLPKGTTCANAFCHEQSIAEYVVAMAVLLRRDLLAQDRALREDTWSTPVYHPALPHRSDLRSARVGLVGFGNIGKAAWQAFAALGVQEGYAVTRSRPATNWAAGHPQWSPVDALDDVCEAADVLVVSAPLTPESRGLISQRRLELLGPQGVLINVGRGPVVDEAALFEALRSGSLGGAAIDVWYSYPADGSQGAPSALPFADLPNVVMTPHTSGLTLQTFAARIECVAVNIERLRSGQPLENVIVNGESQA
ncbi:2-hydroxyacid dehydrogenase [Demetria terragena]|uniref:2-hydroxyacid dehydrogenase n=1 Tax=Demetria terragena TaxID=63959 RepID=UPI000362D59A|nr:2-hydroxyacid dehydrogenase [Demetria terragena]